MAFGRLRIAFFATSLFLMIAICMELPGYADDFRPTESINIRSTPSGDSGNQEKTSGESLPSGGYHYASVLSDYLLIIVIFCLLIVNVIQLLLKLRPGLFRRWVRDGSPKEVMQDATPLPEKMEDGAAQLRELSSRLEAYTFTLAKICEALKGNPCPEAPAPNQDDYPKAPLTKEHYGRLAEIYMQTRVKHDQWGSFDQRFMVLHIGVANARERRISPEIQPEFQSSDYGEYSAIPFAEEGQDYFAVVPRLGLPINEHTLGPGAIALVFDCPGFQTGRQYRDWLLNKPAVFRQLPGDKWEICRKGSIDLGRGE